MDFFFCVGIFLEKVIKSTFGNFQGKVRVNIVKLILKMIV